MEYEYTNGKRDYIISSAHLSEELQSILCFSKSGKTIKQISEILVNEEITEKEARDFIEELIDHQILVSELEPVVSGHDFLDHIISILNRIEATDEAATLISIKNNLTKADRKIGNSFSLYSEIEKSIRSFNAEYDQKYLFQTDLYFKDRFSLASYWKKQLKEAISFLNKISLYQQDTYLERFKNAFHKRFEKQEVSLAYVLDTEIGIGYRQDIPAKGLHPYLEDIEPFLAQEKNNLKIELNPFQQILNKKNSGSFIRQCA
ncbi:hypothetical protein HX13_03650 [Chryseobacterium sp. P1-3]|uniref:lantibiotic dehydratase n=1 Tax=Chryseobacterium sp. (strain P1-3) TaxID=1517683 RepID=UPI0004E7101E|nr:lantibiotic dehydratase [Chryseobacterium sp. P1-3]KFF75328.1 hypothetical protein HX13_03650 [Chryseobacterium sp. P1-3]